LLLQTQHHQISWGNIIIIIGYLLEIDVKNREKRLENY
jgi:hypothetical protein